MLDLGGGQAKVADKVARKLLRIFALAINRAKRSLNVLNPAISWVSSTKTAGMPSANTPPQRSPPFYVPTFDIARFLVDPSSQDHCNRARRMHLRRVLPHHRLWHSASNLIGCLQSHRSILRIVIRQEEKTRCKKPLAIGSTMSLHRSRTRPMCCLISKMYRPQNQRSLSKSNISQTPNLSPGFLY